VYKEQPARADILPPCDMSAGGLAGFRNVISTVMQSFAITCEISVLWLMLGYSLAFAEGNDFIGGGEKFWFRGDDTTGRFLKLSGCSPFAYGCCLEDGRIAYKSVIIDVPLI